MIRDVVSWPDKRLKLKSELVGILDTRLISDMWDTLQSLGGVGLSAIQVGEPRALFILDKSALGQVEAEIPEILQNNESDLLVFINPVIVNRSTTTETSWEGCLSFPEVFLKVERSKDITIKYANQEGREVEVSTSGFLARALLHEMDHLDGVVFTRHVGSLKRSMVEKKLIKRK